MKAVLQNSDIVILLCLCYNKYAVEYTMIVNIKSLINVRTRRQLLKNNNAKNLQQQSSGWCDLINK